MQSNSTNMVSVIKLLAIVLMIATFGTGCIGLPFLNIGGPDAITFTEGELRSTESASFGALEIACHAAIDALGYADAETLREDDHLRWQARTVGGDPVEIHLNQSGRNQIMLRIRIGMIGDEARSRLVLEEIHRSLAGHTATES